MYRTPDQERYSEDTAGLCFILMAGLACYGGAKWSLELGGILGWMAYLSFAVSCLVFTAFGVSYFLQIVAPSWFRSLQQSKSKLTLIK